VKEVNCPIDMGWDVSWKSDFRIGKQALCKTFKTYKARL
jgi:hypothetical protein